MLLLLLLLLHPGHGGQDHRRHLLLLSLPADGQYQEAPLPESAHRQRAGAAGRQGAGREQVHLLEEAAAAAATAAGDGGGRKREQGRGRTHLPSSSTRH